MTNILQIPYFINIYKIINELLYLSVIEANIKNYIEKRG